jgi:hypothetical protein
MFNGLKTNSSLFGNFRIWILLVHLDPKSNCFVKQTYSFDMQSQGNLKRCYWIGRIIAKTLYVNYWGFYDAIINVLTLL